jgi:UDP-N-acetylglucosamine--N-acetylmuramyl-(pentapeptide) pyrophosphoryl-undecaprenol N-acetylglucosamine transferase
MTRILFAGGGSIGHIAPSVAVFRAAQKLDPSVEAYFVCSPKPEEAEFLQKEGLAFTQIKAPRLGMTLPTTFPSSLHAGMSIVGTFQPDVVFCKGGSISVPIGIAAQMRKIPIVLHESDAVGGYANWLVAKWADVICDGFPQAVNVREEGDTEKNRHVFTGNPIRPGITSGSKEEGLHITGFSGKRPVLLVLGGSQGAAALNDAIQSQLDQILKQWDIIHLTGRGKESDVRREGYWSIVFAHEELPHLYAITTVALSRAGAGSISELAANGIPLILVPLRDVGHDHQQKNAERVAVMGGCVLLDQEHLSNKLLSALTILLDDQQNLDTMREQIQKLSISDSATHIAKILLGAAKK